MDCGVCRGACCESITLDVQFGTDDLQRFLELRTKPVLVDGRYQRNFNVPCSALMDGRCGIYPHRPQVCRDFAPGAPACLATVRARRTREQYQAIRGPEDPHYDGTPAAPALAVVRE